MRILICDDDDITRNLLKRYIQEYFARQNIAIPEFELYSNGLSLLEDTGNCDFLFLDIEMPGPDGIYVGTKIKQHYPYSLIFIVTAYPQYLDDAMRINVFRYLSKPIDKQRLFRNLADGLRYYYSNNKRIAIESKGNVTDMFLKDILMVQRTGRNIYLHTTIGVIDAVQPFSYWLNTLNSPAFFQSHRSYIINMEHVTHFDKDSIELEHGMCTAYLSTRKYSQFRKAHITYIESTR